MAVYFNVCSQFPLSSPFKHNLHFYPQHIAQHLVHIRLSILCMNNTFLTLQCWPDCLTAVPFILPYPFLWGQGPGSMLALILQQEIQHKQNECDGDLRVPRLWTLYCFQVLLSLVIHTHTQRKKRKKSEHHLQTKFFSKNIFNNNNHNARHSTRCRAWYIIFIFHLQNIFPKRKPQTRRKCL